jgi:hypothetical protein
LISLETRRCRTSGLAASAASVARKSASFGWSFAGIAIELAMPALVAAV